MAGVSQIFWNDPPYRAKGPLTDDPHYNQWLGFIGAGEYATMSLANENQQYYETALGEYQAYPPPEPLAIPGPVMGDHNADFPEHQDRGYKYPYTSSGHATWEMRDYKHKGVMDIAMRGDGQSIEAYLQDNLAPGAFSYHY